MLLNKNEKLAFSNCAMEKGNSPYPPDFKEVMLRGSLIENLN